MATASRAADENSAERRRPGATTDSLCTSSVLPTHRAGTIIGDRSLRTIGREWQPGRDGRKDWILEIPWVLDVREDWWFLRNVGPPIRAVCRHWSISVRGLDPFPIPAFREVTGSPALSLVAGSSTRIRSRSFGPPLRFEFVHMDFAGGALVVLLTSPDVGYPP